MTLEEKIRPHAQYWDCYNDCGLDYDHTGKLIKITEEFAIRFYNWMQDNYTQVDDSFVKPLSIDESKQAIITIEKALQIYKAEEL